MAQQASPVPVATLPPPPPIPESGVVTTDQIQKYLDENKQLILAILDNQNLGKLSESSQYQAQLQRNLLFLAALADEQPQTKAIRAQMTPHGVMPQTAQVPQNPPMAQPIVEQPQQQPYNPPPQSNSPVQVSIAQPIAVQQHEQSQDNPSQLEVPQSEEESVKEDENDSKISEHEERQSHIPAVIVFGDSTVDTGNNNVIGTVLKSNFTPYGRDFINGVPTGRFSNGRLPPGFISEALGLPPFVPAYLDPAYGIKDFAKGVCFASAGTGLDTATARVLNVIPIWKEVEYFKDYQRRLGQYVGFSRAKYIVNEAVYIISIGTNDFLENYYLGVTGRNLEYTVEEYQNFLTGQAAEFLTEIYKLGARKISFTGLSAIGCLPLERTVEHVLGLGGCNEKYNKVARDYNLKLQRMIEGLNAKLPGLKLRYGSVYDSFLSVINEPAKYGIENVERGCCATGTFEMGYRCKALSSLTCPDADKYAFWDSFHPTQKVSRLMANLTLETSLKEFI